MIKCPNCGMMAIDGTLLCDGCAMDLLDVMPEPMPAAAPEALSASGFDVMPFEGEGASGAPLVSTLRPPTGIPAPMAEMMSADQSSGIAPPMASPVTVLAPSARATGLAPAEEMPTPAEIRTSFRPPTGLASPTPLPAAPEPPRVSALQMPQPSQPPRPKAPRVSSLSPGLRPRFVVVRGGRLNSEYPIYDGENFIGRSDDAPVDIDLCDQEPKEKTYASRQHAVVTYEEDGMYVTDLNSANGTFVNKDKLEPHVKRALRHGDYVQTGSVMFVVKTY